MTMIYSDGCRFCQEMAAELAPPGFQVRLPQTPAIEMNGTNATNATSTDVNGTLADTDVNGTEEKLNETVVPAAAAGSEDELPEQEKRVELGRNLHLVWEDYGFGHQDAVHQTYT